MRSYLLITIVIFSLFPVYCSLAAAPSPSSLEPNTLDLEPSPALRLLNIDLIESENARPYGGSQSKRYGGGK